MQVHSTLVCEFDHIVDALEVISASTEALLMSQPTPALHEFERIVDAIGAITGSVGACVETLTRGETTPDTFPADWCEGGDAA